MIEVSGEAEGFVVRCEGGAVYEARRILFATGVVDEMPPLAGIDDLFGRSVHVCPYCDGWEHRDAPIAVFGKGAKGAGLALMLRQWTDDLVLCTHGPPGLSRDEAALLEKRGIRVQPAPISRLEGDNGCLRAIHFENGDCLVRQALFFNTDQHPRSTLLESLGCAFDEKGVTFDNDGRTSVRGVYVAGDASRDVQLVVIATAEGARTALVINRELLVADGHLPRHKLGKEEALRRIKPALGKASQSFPVLKVEQEVWSKDRMDFRVRALGQVAM